MERLTGRCGDGTAYYKIVPGESTIERLAAIEDILGDDYDLNRLRELVGADRDGRCVVLPCKVGDIVFNTYWWDEKQEILNCNNGEIYYRPVKKHKVTKSKFSPLGLDYLQFGKSVFLTREAAEAALKGEQDE